MPKDGRPEQSNEAEKRGLENVEKLRRFNLESCWLHETCAKPAEVRSVGIVGAGIMGTAIAAMHVERSIPTVVLDADRTALEAASEKVVAQLIDDLPQAEAKRLVEQFLRTADDVAGLADCGFVIESIVEDAAVKRQLYAKLEDALPPGVLLGTNTSTIPIARLATQLKDPSRFFAYHFFHPARRRELLEIVPGAKTSERALATAVAHGRAIGKMPIIVKDGPGFLVNRLLLFYMGEAMELLLEGATIEQIERAATDFGMAMGPLRLLDEIGLDTSLHGGMVLWEAFADRVVASPLLVAMVKRGRLGCKTSGGFFCYDGCENHGMPAEETLQIIDQWAGAKRQHSAESITNRLLLPMLLEATRIIADGQLRDPRDVDLGLLFGAGFPQSRGGLLFWSDELSAGTTLEMLAPLKILGARGEPTPMLMEMAENGGRFYSR